MPNDKHRVEYEKRVNRVLDHIREHLAEPLELEALAHVAAFSPFHFHRIFKAMTGENLREHIQRVRVESAATMLRLHRDLDVTSIALDCGFSSPSAFARAFRERFGTTATAWRDGLGCADGAESKPGEANGKPGKAAPDGLGQLVSMELTIKNLPPHRIAYLRNTGPYGPGGGIGDTWLRLARWAQARDLWTAERVCLGIALDDPMVTEPARCRYDAAIVIPPGFVADGPVNVSEFAGGKHAVAAFDGSVVDIGLAWHQMFGGCLPGSGFQPDSRPCFERYVGEAWQVGSEQIRCELCVPVRPL